MQHSFRCSAYIMQYFVEIAIKVAQLSNVIYLATGQMLSYCFSRGYLSSRFL